MSFFKWNKSKYKNEKISHAGYKFDSKLEANLFDILKMREKAGEITNLRTQVNVHLTRAKILYQADFCYEIDGQEEYAESKGFETVPWRIKRRLWMYYGPAKLMIYKSSGHGIVLAEEIIPKKLECTCGNA